MLKFSNRPGLIGLDIGSDQVKAAQLVRASGRWVEHASATFARSNRHQVLTVSEAEQIVDALCRLGFTGRKAALAVPAEALAVSLLELPPETPQAPRERLVRMEIARVQKLSPDNLSCCWSELPHSEHRTGTQTLCWAMRHEVVEPALDALEHAGLEVTRMEPGAIALWRASAPMLTDPSRISAVADIGAGAARLILLHRGQVVHERVLPDWGAQSLVQTLSEKWSAPEPLARGAMCRYGVASGEATGVLALDTAGTLGGLLDEMIEQIALSFSFVSHQYPDAELGPLLLTGGVAGMPGLPEVLAEGLQIQVVPLTSGVLIDGCRAPSSTGLVAYGLAMGEGMPDA